MDVESHCGEKPSPPPGPPRPPSTNCTFTADFGGFGGDAYTRAVESKEDCCALCLADLECTVAVYGRSTCHIKHEETNAGRGIKGDWACRARPTPPSQ